MNARVLLLGVVVAAAQSTSTAGASLHPEGALGGATCGWKALPAGPITGSYVGLGGVSADSAHDVWAVGQLGGTSSGVIAHRDSQGWTYGTVSGDPGRLTVLNGVAVISQSDVWAVGNAPSPSTYVVSTLAEHWNGSAWSVVPTVDPPSGEAYLSAVAAVASNDVWAVGSEIFPAPRTIAEHWDGSAWSLVTTPNPGSRPSLSGVAARSTRDVWAVGAYQLTYTTPLAEHWNGTAWRVIATPPASPTNAGLAAVTEISRNDVWAVGWYFPAGGNFSQTLTEHWDGSAWHVVPSPNSPKRPWSVLTSVSGSASNDVWAVGSGTNGPLHHQHSVTLAMHWDGSAWTVVPTPNPGVHGTQGAAALSSVVAISASTVYAVGRSTDGTTGSTLVEAYCR